MKQKFHKQDVFTLNQMIDILSRQEQVTISHPTPETFQDWGSFYNKYYKHYQHVKKNHVFKCKQSNSSYKALVQLWDQEPAYSSANGGWDMRTQFAKDEGGLLSMRNDQPLQLNPPGIQLIKQVELYKKWRPFVPPLYQDIICPNPGLAVLELVKQSKLQKRKARQKEKETSLENQPLGVRELDMNN